MTRLTGRARGAACLALAAGFGATLAGTARAQQQSELPLAFTPVIDSARPDTAPVATRDANRSGADAVGRCKSRSYRTATRTGAVAVFVGGNAALYEYFRRAWWSGERADFHVNWERDSYFRQADKLGHLYGGYFLTVGGRELLRAACYSERKSALWGAAYAAAFQLQIEIWDGYQAYYGFSPPDLAANTLGAALAVTHTFAPKTRAIKPTVSYRRTRALKNVANFPPGAQGYDLRPTVDYSGQTYWFSADVDALLPAGARAYWPDLVRLSAGRSITNWVDPTTGQFQTARPVFVLTLDVDPEKLPGNHPLWRTVKKGLSYYHFPAPALVLTPSTKLHAWYR